ncbi:MAG: hypothetical protein WBZ16_20485 [Pseudolabrys sp.]|jgi:hypothetical protein
MHLAVTLALRNFPPQVRQADISAIALNQILFSVLARAPALVATQSHQVAGILSELQ